MKDADLIVRAGAVLDLSGLLEVQLEPIDVQLGETWMAWGLENGALLRLEARGCWYEHMIGQLLVDHAIDPNGIIEWMVRGMRLMIDESVKSREKSRDDAGEKT